MSWGRLDDGYHAHPKLERAGLAAAGLHAKAISYAAHYLTDGFVDAAWVERQTSGLTRRTRAAVLEACTREGLLDALSADEMVTVCVQRLNGQTVELGPFPTAGYLIHDFLEHNFSRAEVEEQRRKERQKKVSQRARRAQERLPWDLAGGSPPTSNDAGVPRGQPGVSPGDSPSRVNTPAQPSPAQPSSRSRALTLSDARPQDPAPEPRPGEPLTIAEGGRR